MKRRAIMIPTMMSGGAPAVFYTISGTVYDADGTTAVASATVALGALSATSGVDGTYTISNVPAGTSGSMTCTKAGYSWAAITVSAMAANLTAQNYTNAWWAVGGIAASCVAAYQAKGAASYAASKVNLANPGTNNITDGAAYPTWATATGWTFLKTSNQYLDTGITGITKNYTVIVQFSDTTDGRLFGSDDGNVVHVYPVLAGSHYYRFFVDGGATAGNVASGNMCMTNGVAYLNGVSDDTFTSGAGATSKTLYLGGHHNNDNTLRDPVTGKIQAFAIYNTSLNGTQVAALATAMAAIP